MLHNKKKSYCFFQHVDSNHNLLLTLQSPYTPTNFWQFCFSRNLLDTTEFNLIYPYHEQDDSDMEENVQDKFECTTLPNLIEVRQQYQKPNELIPELTQKSSIKITETSREIQKSKTEFASNTLLDVPSKWEIVREEICESEEDEKALRNYLFSM